MSVFLCVLCWIRLNWWAVLQHPTETEAPRIFYGAEMQRGGASGGERGYLWVDKYEEQMPLINCTRSVVHHIVLIWLLCELSYLICADFHFLFYEKKKGGKSSMELYCQRQDRWRRRQHLPTLSWVRVEQANMFPELLYDKPCIGSVTQFSLSHFVSPLPTRITWYWWAVTTRKRSTVWRVNSGVQVLHLLQGQWQAGRYTCQTVMQVC